MKLGQFQIALMDYQYALRINQDAHFYHHRGLCFHKLNQTEEALQDFKRAIQINATYG